MNRKLSHCLITFNGFELLWVVTVIVYVKFVLKKKSNFHAGLRPHDLSPVNFGVSVVAEHVELK